MLHKCTVTQHGQVWICNLAKHLHQKSYSLMVKLRDNPDERHSKTFPRLPFEEDQARIKLAEYIVIGLDGTINLKQFN